MAPDHIIAMMHRRCSAQIGVVFECSFNALLVTEEAEAQAFMTAAGLSHTCQHDTHTFISAHRVNGDMRLACHSAPLIWWSRAYAPTAITSRPL